MTNYTDAIGTLGRSFTEADAMVGVGWAVLAVADELRAAREAAEPEVAPEDTEWAEHVYVLIRTLPDRTSDTVSVFLSEDKARREVQNLNIQSVKQSTGVTWSIVQHRVDGGV